MIPEWRLEAAARSIKFSVLSILNRALSQADVDLYTVQKRLIWSKRKVMRLLKGKDDLGMREMAELLWAIDGSAWEFSLEPIPAPKQTWTIQQYDINRASFKAKWGK